MAIHEHKTTFAGKPVRPWQPGEAIQQPADSAVRLWLDYDEESEGTTWADKFAALLDQPNVGELYGLVVGNWAGCSTHEEDSGLVIEALVAAREQLAGLRALFIGDITSEECEISWMQQSDLAPLWAAFPALEHFGVRGNEGLSLGTLQHAKLRTLIVESGGLDVAIVEQVASAKLPALEHLELWLGDDYYGADTRPPDLQPILSGTLFPRLRYLGLRDSDIADDVAHALQTAPIVAQLETLDLSLGTLTDDGAKALLKNTALKQLKKLDIHHHFCSPEVVAELAAAVADLDASEMREPETWSGEEHRYVAVSE